jgi:hypothetical protein
MTFIRASTSDITTLPVIGSTVISKEVGNFENSTILEEVSPLCFQVAT